MPTDVTSVFIGGSRKLGRLNEMIRHRLDQIIDKQYTLLIGDANGTDKAVQAYLASRKYASVVVYCTKGICRNNIGGWNSRAVNSPSRKRDFSYYAAKDVAMARDASYGFMIWDGQSKGTFSNLMNLAKQGKTSLVYFGPKNRLAGCGAFSYKMRQTGFEPMTFGSGGRRRALIYTR